MTTHALSFCSAIRLLDIESRSRGIALYGKSPLVPERIDYGKYFQFVGSPVPPFPLAALSLMYDPIKSFREGNVGKTLNGVTVEYSSF